jgi:hypothetical protein
MFFAQTIVCAKPQRHQFIDAIDLLIRVAVENSNETPPFQPLREQTRTLAVPPDDLEQITPPSPEHKQMAGIGIEFQDILSLCGQRIKAAPHVRHPSVQPNPCIRWHRDQGISPSTKDTGALLTWPS